MLRQRRYLPSLSILHAPFSVWRAIDIPVGLEVHLCLRCSPIPRASRSQSIGADGDEAGCP